VAALVAVNVGIAAAVVVDAASGSEVRGDRGRRLSSSKTEGGRLDAPAMHRRGDAAINGSPGGTPYCHQGAGITVLA
jgi:hypothetical protein